MNTRQYGKYNDIKFHSLFIVIVKETHTHARAWLGTRATDECGYIQFRRGVTINTHSLRDALNSDQTHVRRVCQSTLPVIYWLLPDESGEASSPPIWANQCIVCSAGHKFQLRSYGFFSVQTETTRCSGRILVFAIDTLDCSIDLLNLSASRALPLAKQIFRYTSRLDLPSKFIETFEIF